MIKILLTRFYILLLLTYIFTACKISEYSHNESVSQEVIKSNSNEQTVTVQAGKLYKAGKFKRYMLGDHYRDTWLAPVEVPVLDLDEAKGGLEIIERGGGMQTYSLKLKGNDGKLYSLRSVQKDPTPTLPMALQYSFADDLVQDQISASHPYGAFILPALGEAAGIYHTNPKLYYIPDLPALGEYRKDFGGILAMLEEDADEDWSDYEDFGYTENAVSTETVREEVLDDNDNKVDEMALLRTRLFDMWIGDWDRHGGQFRWAEFKDNKGKLYKPIPEDRDNIFFKFDGVIPWIASRKWALRKFQDFKPEVRDIAGLNFNARFLDRRFLTGLSQDSWVQMANDLQERLTNEVIESAVQQLPDTVYELNGQELIHTLKARRDNLDKFARDYYKVLAKQVDIVGSDRNEYFEVKRMTGGDTEVKVFKASDEGHKKREIYNRTFHNDETDEIRLYGMDDRDFFYITGRSDEGLLIRAIGGFGKDTFIDSSRVKGLKRKNIVYDTPEDTELKVHKETKKVFSSSLDVNRYEYKAFEYDLLGPSGYFGFNSDDGLYLGGGLVIKTHGFRKEPYATYQQIVANFAPKTSAWNFQYEGDFTDVIGKMGVNLELLVQAPNYFSNFYGFGNETEKIVDDDDFYKVRYDRLSFTPGFTFRLSEHADVKFGPSYQFVEVNPDEDRFINLIAPTLGPDIFLTNHYAGFKFEADVRTVENVKDPEKGVRWLSEIGWHAQLNNQERKYSQFKSEFSAYYTIDIPFETTFAVRIGGASNAGDFEFYQGNTIGGNAGLSRLGNVRGFDRDRFTGRSSIYQNNEVRMRLLKIPFYYLPFSFGISGHFDQGRVWIKGEDSNKWHRGVGGGIWFSPLGRWVFTAVYTHSEEDNQINVNLGFLF